MTSMMASEACRNDPRVAAVPATSDKEPPVQCHDLWKSCWVQGDQYKKYQAASAATAALRSNSPFNPSNFQPASVFLKSSTLKTDLPYNNNSSVYNKNNSIDAKDDSKSTISIGSSVSRSKSETSPFSALMSQPISPSNDMDAYDKSYESALRRNASLSLGLTVQKSSGVLPHTKSSSALAGNQRNLVHHQTQYRPPLSSQTLNKYDTDFKRLDFINKHLLSSANQTPSQISPTSTTSSSNITSTVTLPTPSVTSSNMASFQQESSYPLQYGTLPHKKSNKPRPLQSRTLQRHKSSAEIYSKTAGSSSTLQNSSSLNRLMSISAEDIRRSLKGTNDALQRLLSYGKKKASVKSLSDDNKLSKDVSCVKNGG